MCEVHETCGPESGSLRIQRLSEVRDKKSGSDSEVIWIAQEEEEREVWSPGPIEVPFYIAHCVASTVPRHRGLGWI